MQDRCVRCGQVLQGTVCPFCGYDLSVEYTRRPTVQPVPERWRALPAREQEAALERRQKLTEYLLREAEAGSAVHQCLAGVAALFGAPGPAREQEAVDWFHRAAAQGHAPAQELLREIFEAAPSGPEPDGTPEEWYRQGVSLYEGSGAAQDYAGAVQWFRRAAQEGHAEAQFMMGVCYHCGRGVDQDDAEASAWYRRAAEQDDPLAKMMLQKFFPSELAGEEDGGAETP